jgi:hypothetical protein
MFGRKSREEIMSEAFTKGGQVVMFEMVMALAIMLEVSPKKLGKMLADEKKIASFGKELTEAYTEIRMKQMLGDKKE